MTKIKSEIIEEVVYNLCLQAGQYLSQYSYDKILEGYKKTKNEKLAHILKNAENAKNIQRPLCQDTGTVHVFLEIGNEISFEGNPTEAINSGVKKCYINNYFRKSIVENGFKTGKNLETNTPALISTEYKKGNNLTIKVLLKGAGCDNVSDVQMLLPTIKKEDFIELMASKIIEKGINACPPLFVSIAIGTGAEKVLEEAEKAYFEESNDLPEIQEKILSLVQKKAKEKYNDNFYIADLKITAKPHHMASLPVAAAFNCHSLRIASAQIFDNKILYSKTVEKFEKIQETNSQEKEIDINDKEACLKLKEGEKVLLSGEILIARDAAHKKMLEYKNKGKKIPFDIKDKTIFYAAPCSAAPNETVGPIGPTTAHRMDKFLSEFPEIFATMGKGKRSKEAENFIKNNNLIYFEIEGGISTLLSSCFQSYKVIAFEDLSTEAVCAAKIKKLPAKVSIIKSTKNKN